MLSKVKILKEPRCHGRKYASTHTDRCDFRQWNILYSGRIGGHWQAEILLLNSTPILLQKKILMSSFWADWKRLLHLQFIQCRKTNLSHVRIYVTSSLQLTFHPQFFHICFYCCCYDPDRKSYENEETHSENCPTVPPRETTQLEENRLKFRS